MCMRRMKHCTMLVTMGKCKGSTNNPNTLIIISISINKAYNV